MASYDAVGPPHLRRPMAKGDSSTGPVYHRRPRPNLSHEMPVVTLPSDPSAAGARPGLRGLRPAPTGMPDPDRRPPVEAASGDPFSAVRVLDLVARLERGRATRLDDLVDRLNATWLDWLFTRAVVIDVLVAAPGELDGRLPERVRDRRSRTDPSDRPSPSRTPAASTHGSSVRRSARLPRATTRCAPSPGVTGRRTRHDPGTSPSSGPLRVSGAGPVRLIGTRGAHPADATRSPSASPGSPAGRPTGQGRRIP